MDFFKTLGKGITQGFEQFITNDLENYIPLFIVAAVLIIAVLIRNWFRKKNMRFKDQSKLTRSIYRLEEITHKYGNYEILERYEDVSKSDLDTAHVVIARQIEAMGIEHLLLWKKWWRIWKHSHKNLNTEQLTIIIYKALVDLKQIYLDLIIPENDKDEERVAIVSLSLEKDLQYIKTLIDKGEDVKDAFDYSLSQKDREIGENIDSILVGESLLNTIGITNIKTCDDVDAFLWRLSNMGFKVSRGIRNAMVEITSDNEIIDYIDYRSRQYNRAMEKHLINKDKVNIEIKIIKKKVSIPPIIKQKNYLIQIVSLLFTYVKDPHSRLCKTYDFNKVAEMKAYLKWFVCSGRTISSPLAQKIVDECITDDNAKQQFLDLVNETNNQIIDSSY